MVLNVEKTRPNNKILVSRNYSKIIAGNINKCTPYKCNIL